MKYQVIILLSVCILLGLAVIPLYQKQDAAVNTPFHFASIDTMKESMDTARNQLTDSQIANTVNLISTLHTTYITVDVFWDYPDYMQRWVNAVRATGKHVWFRIHPNAWEGNNGVAAHMNPQQYLIAEQIFITTHPTLFKSGDILDMNPEPENGPYWKNTYGTNWTRNTQATDAYNAFYIAVSDVAAQSLQQIGITGVITTIRSTNSWFAKTPKVLYPATIAHMGRVTIDSYPDADTTDPTTAVNKRITELQTIENIREVPIVIGEFGYSNHINVDDSIQHMVVQAELHAIQHLSYIEGLNYWVGPASQNSGGYTRIFTGNKDNWSLRPAAYDVSSFFQTMLSNIVTDTPTPSPIILGATTSSNENPTTIQMTSHLSGTEEHVTPTFSFLPLLIEWEAVAIV